MLDNEALTHLYLRHIAALRGFLAARIGCRETAGELAHESFVRLMASGRGEAVLDPRAFLFRIAGNLAIDHWRANPVRPERFADIAECEHLVSEAPGPERHAAARQQLERLRRAVEGLPPRCRRIFVRHKFDGLTQLSATGIFEPLEDRHIRARA